MKRSHWITAAAFALGCLVIIAASLTSALAQSEAAAPLGSAALFGRNLMVNGGGEQDRATPGGREVVPISGWTVEGHFTVVPYASPDPAYGGIRPGSPIPSGAGANFFAGGPDNAASSATQLIDVAGAAGPIDQGKVRFALAGYLGGYGDQEDQAALSAAFRSAQGTTLGEAKVGPVGMADRGKKDGLLLRQTAGPIPAGTRTIAVKLVMTRKGGKYNDGYADEVSLELSGPGEPTLSTAKPPELPRPATTSALLNRNLIVNGGGEQDKATPGGREVVSISGWTPDGKITLVPYAAPDPNFGGIQSGAPIPPLAGKNFFAGGPDNGASAATQVINVSEAAALIDTGKVRYSLSGYLGGDKDQDDQAVLSAVFLNAQGASLGETKVGPVLRADRGSNGGLLLRETTGTVPAGVRSVAVKLAMTRVAGRYNDGYADEISLILADTGGSDLTPASKAGSVTASPCPKILADFLQLMVDGQESQALALTTERFRQAPSAEKQGVRQMVRGLAETNLVGMDAIAVSPNVTHLLVGVKSGDGRKALLFVEFMNDKINQLDWRASQ